MEIKIMIEKVFYDGNSFTEPIVSFEDWIIINFNIFVVPYDHFFSYMAWYYPVYP